MQLAATDFQRRSHVMFEHGLGHPVQGVLNFLEKRLVGVAQQTPRVVVVARLAHHVDGMVTHPFEVAADDVKRPDAGHFRGGGPGLAVQGGEAGVFDDAFQIVDIVVAGLDLGDGLFVAVLQDSDAPGDLSLDFHEQEFEIALDLKHRLRPGR